MIVTHLKSLQPEPSLIVDGRRGGFVHQRGIYRVLLIVKFLVYILSYLLGGPGEEIGLDHHTEAETLETGWERGSGVHVETGGGVHEGTGGGVHEGTGGGVHEGKGGGVNGGDCLEIGRGERGEGCTQTGVKGTQVAWIEWSS